jgi:hypothetical protein
VNLIARGETASNRATAHGAAVAADELTDGAVGDWYCWCPRVTASDSGAWLKMTDASHDLGPVAGPEYQPPSNRSAPLLHTPLKSPQLAGAEWCRRLGLKALEERLGSRVRLLVEPLPDKRPDVLEWIHSGSPVPRSGRWLPVCRAHLTVAPGGRETVDELAQFLAGLCGLSVFAAGLMASQVPLRLADAIQQRYRIQRRKDLAQLIFAFVRDPITGQEALVRRGRNMVLLLDLRADPNLRFQFERRLEEVDVQSGHLVQYPQSFSGRHTFEPAITYRRRLPT